MSRRERLQQPEFADEALEDALTSIEAQIHSVQNRLTRAGLRGFMSAESKRQVKLFLELAARRVDQIPEKR